MDSHFACGLRLARELDLVVTAGSDFHAPQLEITHPVVELPIAYAPQLREWLADAPAIQAPSNTSAHAPGVMLPAPDTSCFTSLGSPK